MAAETISKTGAIKKYLAKRPDATASEIIPALAKDGIEVSQGLVNNTRSRLKKQGGIRSAARRGSRGGALTAQDLLEAKKLVEMLGGLDNARQALNMLDDLGA